MACGISRANAVQVYLTWDFNRFPVFGFAHEHIMEFGVVKSNNLMRVFGRKAFSKSLGLKHCDTIFLLFSNMIFDSPTYSWKGYFGWVILISVLNIQSFGFWTFLDCHLIVLQYSFGDTPLFGLNRRGSNLFHLRLEVRIRLLIGLISWNRSSFQNVYGFKWMPNERPINFCRRSFCTRPKLHFW